MISMPPNSGPEQYRNCWIDDRWYGPDPPPEQYYRLLRPKLPTKFKERGEQSFAALAKKFPETFSIQWEYEEGPDKFEDEHGAGYCPQTPRDIHSMLLFNNWGTVSVDVRSETLLLDMAQALETFAALARTAANHCRQMHAQQEGRASTSEI